MRRLGIAPMVLAIAIVAVEAKPSSPLIYTSRFPDPASKTFTVDVAVPTEGRASVDLMMPVCSPGFYGLQNYAQRVSQMTAKAADGTALDIANPSPSRWAIATGGSAPTPLPSNGRGCPSSWRTRGADVVK